jgi:hypothetical protein
VLEYADQLTQTPVEVDETLFEGLRAKFNAAQLVELTATIAWENYRARFNHAFGRGVRKLLCRRSLCGTGSALAVIGRSALAAGYLRTVGSTCTCTALLTSKRLKGTQVVYPAGLVMSDAGRSRLTRYVRIYAQL